MSDRMVSWFGVGVVASMSAVGPISDAGQAQGEWGHLPH
jgi:hypothetical protein